MSTGTVVRYEDLQPGQRVRITQRVKVGFKVWQTEVQGVVERIERRRNGLHVKRNFDDRAWTDLILLKKEGKVPEETTVALDEYTRVELLG